MGSEEAKPEIKEPNSPKKEKENFNKSPQLSPRQRFDKSNQNSNRNSAMDNYLNKSPVKSPSKDPDKGPQKRLSPNLKPDRNSSIKPSRNPTKLSNRSIPNPTNKELQPDNEFMPLINWPSEGSIQLNITLVELIVESQPKLGILKNNSTYKATLNWKKINNNIFSFKLRQEPAYEVALQIDLQGEVMSGSERVWLALCPINIAFGRTVKLGNFKCVNMFKKLDETEQNDGEEQQIGPSLKNIDFPIAEEVFKKWGQPIPKSLKDKDQSKKNKINKQKKQKIGRFSQYSETSRYFNMADQWMGSTFVEETHEYYRGWLIETSHIDRKLLTELQGDLLNRQNFYIEAMYNRLN